MTYTIPPDSPKAVKAAAFGRELMKALAARNVPRNELHRVTGVGRTSIDNYQHGRILPKVEVAQALAAALRWPKLAEMIVAARTFVCARSGCSRTFRNDTGAPRRYCSPSCQEIAQKLRTAARENRRAAGEGSWSSSQTAAVRTLRQGLRLADERNQLLDAAIAGMCAECEPEGRCQVPKCPLRPFSPLPLATHDVDEPRTMDTIRRDSWTPEHRAAAVAGTIRRWARPGAREQAAEQMRQYHRDHPEHADLTREGVRRRDERRREREATA